MAIVATLMAGVIGTEYYGLDEKGQVFVLDSKGPPCNRQYQSLSPRRFGKQ
jgi:hypothetical protein